MIDYIDELKRKIAVMRSHKSAIKEEQLERGRIICEISKELAKYEPPHIVGECVRCKCKNPQELILHHKRNELGHRTPKIEIVCYSCREIIHDEIREMNLKTQTIYEINKRSLESFDQQLVS